MASQQHPKFVMQVLAFILSAILISASSIVSNDTESFEEPCPVHHSECTCSGEPFYSVSCENVPDDVTLSRIAGNLTDRTLILELESLNLTTVPLEILRVPFLMSLIIKNSSFSSLFAVPEPCHSDTSNIHHLSLENVTTEDWSWSQLSILKKLDVLFAYNTTIGNNITSQFREYVSKSLKMLSISGSNVSLIESGSFGDLTNLTYLRISHSKLRTLARNILPSQSRIQQLRLDHNQITSLPSDMFQNMDNLTIVSLSNNRISSLPEETYQNFAENNVVLELRNNPIKCDCRIKWIITSPIKLNITGNCSHPKRLFGRRLKELLRTDLRC